MKSVFVLLVILASVIAAAPALAGPILVTDTTDATQGDAPSSEALVAETRWGKGHLSSDWEIGVGVPHTQDASLLDGASPVGSPPATLVKGGDVVPEPGTLALVGVGLAGITFGTVRRRRRI